MKFITGQARLPYLFVCSVYVIGVCNIPPGTIYSFERPEDLFVGSVDQCVLSTRSKNDPTSLFRCIFSCLPPLARYLVFLYVADKRVLRRARSRCISPFFVKF